MSTHRRLRFKYTAFIILIATLAFSSANIVQAQSFPDKIVITITFDKSVYVYGDTIMMSLKTNSELDNATVSIANQTGYVTYRVLTHETYFQNNNTAKIDPLSSGNHTFSIPMDTIDVGNMNGIVTLIILANIPNLPVQFRETFVLQISSKS